MSNKYAYSKLPLHLVILNDEQKGNKVTEKAKINLEKSRGGNDVYSVRYKNDIIWVSDEEFKEYDFKELPVASFEQQLAKTKPKTS